MTSALLLILLFVDNDDVQVVIVNELNMFMSFNHKRNMKDSNKSISNFDRTIPYISRFRRASGVCCFEFLT